MPTISASPNPVGVYAPSTGQATTMVSWNTESAANGTVSYSENGGLDQPLGGGMPAGDVWLPVNLGSTYRLSLKVPGGVAGGGGAPVEVESAMVTTFDLRAEIAAGFSQAYVPKLRPQMITNLVVKPGIDTVRLSFRTTFPTIPTTELRDSAGNWIDGRMPLFGGLRKRHEVEFGFEEALALNHEHSFKIEAFAPPGANISPNKAVVEGKFITGRRHVDVMFETLDVHDDGDSGGAGEFRIRFTAGDVATGAQLGNYAYFAGDISDDDPPIDLGKTLSLTDAHRKLWVEVLAHENDHELGIKHLLVWPTPYDGPSGIYRDDGVEEIVRLVIDVDVDTDPGRWMIPFELRTGDWPLDFVVTGHLGVHAFEGTFISTKIGKLGPPSQSSAYLTEPGSIAVLAVGGVGERTEDVGIGGDGAFYHRSRRRQRAGTGGGSGWTRVELPGRGTPAIAASGKTLDLIDLDARGGVILCRFDPSRPKSAKWRKLGGNFQHVIPALKFGKTKGAEPGLILFGIADDGDLFVRDAHGDGTDWDRLGDRPVRAVAPVSAPGVRAALCAVSDSGALLHFEQRGGRWRQQELARVPGDGQTQLLTTAFIDQTDGKASKSRSRDLIIAAMSEEYRVRALRWPDYPAGSPETRWQDLGPVQGLLAEKKGNAPKRRGSTAKTK